MSKKKANEDESLSLTGSHVDLRPLSGQRPRSAKWTGQPGPAESALRSKPNASNYCRTNAAKGKKSSHQSSESLSQRSTSSAGGGAKVGRKAGSTNGRDDFLALFESSMKQTKSADVKSLKTSVPGHSKPAWATPAVSARSDAAAHPSTSPAPSSSDAVTRLSAGVFPPPSARSSGVGSTATDATTTGRRHGDNELGAAAATDATTGRRHGDNELAAAAQPAADAKTTKLNSIANNMTATPAWRGARPSVLRLETSYQNLTHKTPVNQVTADGSDRRQRAAAVLQRWWRRRVAAGGGRPGGQAGAAAVRRLLAAKRQERGGAAARGAGGGARTEEERRAAREEKARLARLQAIQELQQKREEKRQASQQRAPPGGGGDGLCYLQPGGALTRTPAGATAAAAAAGKSNVRRRTAKTTSTPTDAVASGDEGGSGRPSGGASVTGGGDATGRVTARQVDDLFQASGTRSAEVTSPRRDRLPSNNLNASPREGRENGGGGGGASAVSTKTTLDDLMVTLEKLERADMLVSAREQGKGGATGRQQAAGGDGKQALDWVERPAEPAAGTEARSGGGAPAKDNVTRSGLLSDEKLRSILSYLDEVESADRVSDIDTELVRSNRALELPAPLVPSGDELEQMERASASAAEVTRSTLVQRMELDEKKRTVAMLQKALSQQRELTVRHAKESEREMHQRLHVQKDEYEDAVKRHLSFIDQLIDDKKSLTDRCEVLVRDLKTSDQRARERMTTLQHSHEMDMRKLKDLNAAAEKLRREKWIDEKTKKIKEMTVRGLEPEIQRLIAAHKAELKKVRCVQEAELLASDERAGQRYVEMTETLRDQLAREKEAACGRERELARQTYEKQMEQEEGAYQAQRRRLYAEVGEEKERLATQATRQRADADRMQRQLEDGQRTAAAAIRDEYERARDEQEKRHDAELRQCEGRLSAEQSAWREGESSRRDAWQLARERELREEVRTGRDRDIELVIERLERDAAVAREEGERLADSRLKRMRSKYESETVELERSERMLTEKYNQTKAKLTEVEGENERHKVVVRQKDKEIADLNKSLDRLNGERERVADVVRNEFAERLVGTEAESQSVKMEMSEMRARHRLEMERARTDVEAAQRSKDEEMAAVHDRVKQAIVKKEEVLRDLRQQHQAALKRADHLEGLLEQQRKQLLRK